MGKGKGEEEGSKLCAVYVRSCLRAVNVHYIIHRGGGPDVNLIYPCKLNKNFGPITLQCLLTNHGVR